MVVEIKNKDFASDKHVEFCYATVVKSGNNIPCVDPELVSTKWFGQKEYEGKPAVVRQTPQGKATFAKHFYLRRVV